MSTPHVVILRAFSGFTPGQAVETSGWIHTRSLEEDRYVRRLEMGEIATVEQCEGCEMKVLVAEGLHACIPAAAPPAAAPTPSAESVDLTPPAAPAKPAQATTAPAPTTPAALTAPTTTAKTPAKASA